MRFIVDAMMGNVARELRLLGYDALYVRREADWQVLRLAQTQSRLLVTRDFALMRRARKIPTLFVAESLPGRQTACVLKKLGRHPKTDGLETLSRCLKCGNSLVETTCDEVRSKVPRYVAETQTRFSRCDDCDRIYWPGTHVAGMLRRVAQILDELDEEGEE